MQQSTHRQTGTQADRQADRQTCRHTGRQAEDEARVLKVHQQLAVKIRPGFAEHNTGPKHSPGKPPNLCCNGCCMRFPAADAAAA